MRQAAARARRRSDAKSRAVLLAVLAAGMLTVDAAAQDGAADSSSVPGASAPADSGLSHKEARARKLALELSNPAAPITYMQVRDVMLPNVAGTDGAANALEFQPVLPVGPFHAFPFVQIFKITMPLLVTLPDPDGVTGTGDLQVDDLVRVVRKWGTFAFGASLVAPTASSEQLGAGKWQAGPAAALIYTKFKNLTVGAIFQNPISFAGQSNRADVNALIISPTLTWTLRKGWFAGMSDFVWTFDWEDDGASTIPIGAQVGKIVFVGDQPISLSVEAGGFTSYPAGSPDPGWILGIEITPVFTWHPGDRR